jgi:hypothetical protein
VSRPAQSDHLVLLLRMDRMSMRKAAADRRTLPLRIAPVPGEALDSWLEALAYRHLIPFGMLLQRCGIHHQVLRDDWLLIPDRRQFEHIEHITGVEATTLINLTLARYDGLGLNLGSDARRARPSAWDWRATSRFCPQCLSDSGGRWQIVWRLNWSFACPQHQRLLADTCPKCHALQRRQVHSTRRIPRPGHCACTVRQPSGERHPCYADLASATTSHLTRSHPIVETQERIGDLLSGRPYQLKIYGREQPPRRIILNDLRLIARWVADIPPSSATTHFSTGLTGLNPLPQSTSRDSTARRNPTAAQVAIGVTAAMKVLNSSEEGAASLLHQLMKAAGTHESQGAVRLRAPDQLSPAVRIAHCRARLSTRSCEAFETDAGG